MNVKIIFWFIITNNLRLSIRCCDAQKSFNDRIVHGKRATHSFPFIISLVRHKKLPDMNYYDWFLWNTKEYSSLIHFCGGILINPSWILTAAHCTFYQPLHKIRHGNNYWDKMHSYEVDYCVVHPNFILSNQFSLDDIALIKINQYIDVRSFPNLNKIYHDNQNVTIFGYGRTEHKQMSGILNYFETQLLAELDPCVNTTFETETLLKGKLICSKYQTQTRTAVGDSGGPVMTRDMKTLEAIHLGQIPGPEAQGALETPISYYYRWIEGVLKMPSPVRLNEFRTIFCCQQKSIEQLVIDIKGERSFDKAF